MKMNKKERELRSGMRGVWRGEEGDDTTLACKGYYTGEGNQIYSSIPSVPLFPEPHTAVPRSRGDHFVPHYSLCDVYIICTPSETHVRDAKARRVLPLLSLPALFCPL